MMLYIGLMSGSSLDGVDGVLVALPAARSALAPHVPPPVRMAETAHPSAECLSSTAVHVDVQRDLPLTSVLRLVGHCHLPFDDVLRAELLALNQPGANELHRAAVAANALAAVYATVALRLCSRAGVAVSQIRALGAHGQTVRHQPDGIGHQRYTLQLLNGALLAELTGIDTVCDLRSRDLAAGGQAAPLVPALHAACFATPGLDMAVLNLGGIANLTLLHAGGEVTGLDTGPGNVLMDTWCQRHTGQAFDDGGQWASTGVVDSTLLQRLLAEPYFARQPPKSTGRDRFDSHWLDHHLVAADHVPTAVDVMATLAELSVCTVVDALRSGGMQGPQTLMHCAQEAGRARRR